MICWTRSCSLNASPTQQSRLFQLQPDGLRQTAILNS